MENIYKDQTTKELVEMIQELEKENTELKRTAISHQELMDVHYNDFASLVSFVIYSGNKEQFQQYINYNLGKGKMTHDLIELVETISCDDIEHYFPSESK